ncbi:MAG: hypothetical protein AAFP13_06565 [Pseudomonadota bacterium]
MADANTHRHAETRDFGARGGLAVLAVFAAALFLASHYFTAASGDVPDDPNDPATLRQ